MEGGVGQEQLGAADWAQLSAQTSACYVLLEDSTCIFCGGQVNPFLYLLCKCDSALAIQIFEMFHSLYGKRLRVALLERSTH